MSWLDDILFAPVKWALPDEDEKKLNPLFDAVGAIGNATIQKWDSAAADAVKMAADSADLAGGRDVAKALGRVAEAVDLVGGEIASARAKAAAETVANGAAEAVGLRVGVAIAAGTAGAAATGNVDNFWSYARTGDGLLKGDGGLAETNEIVARVHASALGTAAGAYLDRKEGARAGCQVGLGIGSDLGRGRLLDAGAKAVGTGAGVIAGSDLKVKVRDATGRVVDRRFNYGAFDAASGLTTSSLGLAAPVMAGAGAVKKDPVSAAERTRRIGGAVVGSVTSALSLVVESRGTEATKGDSVIRRAVRATGGIGDALRAVGRMKEVT